MSHEKWEPDTLDEDGRRAWRLCEEITRIRYEIQALMDRLLGAAGRLDGRFEEERREIVLSTSRATIALWESASEVTIQQRLLAALPVDPAVLRAGRERLRQQIQRAYEAGVFTEAERDDALRRNPPDPPEDETHGGE